MDPRWFDVLVSELFSNALRVSPRGSRIDVILTRKGRVARLFFSDRGPGIPRKHLRHLGQPFFQLHSTAAPVSGERGGMGLALASRIALVHGGRLRPALQARGGMSMTVELPLAEAARASIAAARRKRTRITA
jgi:signal transduction histidine kinase